MRFQRWTDSCCRDETASQSLSADQSQLRFRTDRHMSLFLFFRFHCGWNHLWRQAQDVWTDERVKRNLRYAAAALQRRRSAPFLDRGSHPSKRKTGRFLPHHHYGRRHSWCHPSEKSRTPRHAWFPWTGQTESCTNQRLWDGYPPGRSWF